MMDTLLAAFEEALIERGVPSEALEAAWRSARQSHNGALPALRARARSICPDDEPSADRDRIQREPATLERSPGRILAQCRSVPSAGSLDRH
jgi:hypothetical protein